MAPSLEECLSLCLRPTGFGDLNSVHKHAKTSSELSDFLGGSLASFEQN